VMAAIAPGTTPVLANADISITGDFTQNRNAKPDTTLLTGRLRQRAGEGNIFIYPFTQLSSRLLGDAIGSNLMMVGFAWQKGWLHLDLEAFEAAVVLNGTAVAMNRSAFALGRKLAVEPDAVLAVAGLSEKSVEDDYEDENLVAVREAFLAAYQDHAYAGHYRAIVDRVANAEAALKGGGALARTVANGLFRVMSYKDEYEVARLYTEGSFVRSLHDAFEGHVKLTFHMAPPLLAKRDKASGHLRKRKFGAWIMPLFRLLAKARRLRGTRFDPFGYTAERKTERRLIADYEALIERLLARLTSANLSEAARIAGLILDVRGYGHVKERAIAVYEPAVAAAMHAYDADLDLRQMRKAG
jgi:indolepyruvate ferredoxin oxidoreductase